MISREELIYKMRNEGMIYRLIGKHFGVTGVRARQIYEKCARKKRMQEYIKAQEK